MQETIRLKIEKNLATIELSQAQSFLLSHSQREEFKSHLKQIIKNPSIQIAVLLFKNKTSTRSLDIRQIEKIHGREKWERLLAEIHELFGIIESSNTTWIAAIHGACLGNQMELALACDYRIADLHKNTIFGLPELSFGLIPFFGGCIRLPKLIGVRKTLDILLKSQLISSYEAYEMGLLHSVVHPVDLEQSTEDLSKQITERQLPAKAPQQYKARYFIEQVFEIPICRQFLYYLTSRKIMKETKGTHPAPLKLLEVIKETYPPKSIKEALKKESDAFCNLMISSITRNLMSVRFVREKICSSPDQTENIKKVAILGAGVMGRGITQWLADHDTPVLLKDIHAPSLSTSLKRIHSRTYKQSKEIDAKNKMSKIRPQTDYSGFQTADLVIETVIEDINIKKKIITETSSKLHKKCLFATNTSSFSITELAKNHPDPSRFLGLHFFYPAYQTPLVEVVRGEQSSEETISSVFEWLKNKNKVPFVVKDRPGFLVHRLFLPLISEALWLLHEGMDLRKLDQIYSDFGFTMGPFRLMDQLGLDIYLKLIKSFETEKRPLDLPEGILKWRPTFLGRKNNNGFYIYNDASEVVEVNQLIYQDLKLKTSLKNPAPNEVLERGLYRMINEACSVLEEEIISCPEELDLALILGIGFPAFRGGLLHYASDISLKTVVAGLKNFSHTGKRFQASTALLKYAEKEKPFT